MTFDVVFFHLLNDFSGSPKVLRETISALSAQSIRSKIYIGSSGEGFLSICDIPVSRYWYRRTGHKVLTLFTYFFSQVILFLKLLCDRSIDRNTILFVNTLLPFGAALYGKMTGKRIIYHVHEISITPTLLKLVLTTIARTTSSLNLYVSDAHMRALPIKNVPAMRIYNALDDSFLQLASESSYAPRHEGRFQILMIASLRDYKGVPEMLALASCLLSHADIQFHLVVNDDEAAIARYFSGKIISTNLTVYPRTIDPTIFYRKASLVLNLSRVDQWVETFGLTVLEAMAFGIPVVVPPVGGPAELVEDGVHGYLVNSYDQRTLKERVLMLYNNEQLCEAMSVDGRKRATKFSPTIYAANIQNILLNFGLFEN